MTTMLLVVAFISGWSNSVQADEPCAQPPAVTDLYTNVGLLGLGITNLGYIGNSFSSMRPSGEYYLNSNTEHVYSGGLWVGAVRADGQIRVSTGSQDANGVGQGNEIREFDLIGLCEDDAVRVISNLPNADNYEIDALATQHIECNFNDYANPEGGGHLPLGIKVHMKTLAWSTPNADDFVMLNYNIINVGSWELRDLYLGLWMDTTVGNTDETDPYGTGAPITWNYYDD